MVEVKEAIGVYDLQRVLNDLEQRGFKPFKILQSMDADSAKHFTVVAVLEGQGD